MSPTAKKRKKIKLDPIEQHRRLAAANRMLNTFFSRSSRAGLAEMTVEKGYVWVSWPAYQREGMRENKRWQTRGQDFYAIWHHKYPGGGTSMTALSQLVYWVLGKPVFPIATWRYWAMPTVNLVRAADVEQLLADGYPEHVDCVLCGDRIEGGMDWWSLDGVIGPCHTMRSGCRQKLPAVSASLGADI
jgi:hypothetical protein